MHIGNGRRGFGRAITGRQRDAMAGHRDRHGLDALIEVLAHRGAAIGHDAQILEEIGRERRVFLQFGRNHRPAGRHGRVLGGGDLFQIAQRLGEAVRRWRAPIDVKHPAAGKGQMQDRVGAEGMAPGQEIADHRLLFRQSQLRDGVDDRADHRRIGAEHAMRVDHRFRRAGRPRGQQIFADMIMGQHFIKLIDAAARRRRLQIRKSDPAKTLRGVARIDDRQIAEAAAFQRPLKQRAVFNEHCSGLDQPDDGAQTLMVFGEQRIGRRHRTNRGVGQHRAIGRQGMLNAVARQDHQRRLGTKAEIGKGFAQGPHRRKNRRVGPDLPAPIGGALGNRFALRRGGGPKRQGLDRMAGNAAQRIVIVQ